MLINKQQVLSYNNYLQEEQFFELQVEQEEDDENVSEEEFSDKKLTFETFFSKFLELHFGHFASSPEKSNNSNSEPQSLHLYSYIGMVGSFLNKFFKQNFNYFFPYKLFFFSKVNFFIFSKITTFNIFF